MKQDYLNIIGAYHCGTECTVGRIDSTCPGVAKCERYQKLMAELGAYELWEMLGECLDAFNRIRNTSVKPGLKTYDLASKLDKMLKAKANSAIRENKCSETCDRKDYCKNKWLDSEECVGLFDMSLMDLDLAQAEMTK